MGELINIENVSAYLAKPVGEPKGGIIVIHEIWGLNDNTKDIANRFAKEGYIALAPSLLDELDFSKIDISKLQVDLFTDDKREEAIKSLSSITAPIQSPDFKEKTIAKLKDCFDYLYNLPEINQNVSITGFCFGGTYSFSLAVNEPRLKHAFPYYGHFTHSLEEAKNIKAKIYAFYGQNDKTLVFNVPEIVKTMEEAKVDFKYKIYQDCGHAFFNDTNPKTYFKPAADDSWKILSEQVSNN